MWRLLALRNTSNAVAQQPVLRYASTPLLRARLPGMGTNSKNSIGVVAASNVYRNYSTFGGGSGGAKEGQRQGFRIPGGKMAGRFVRTIMISAGVGMGAYAGIARFTDKVSLPSFPSIPSIQFEWPEFLKPKKANSEAKYVTKKEEEEEKIEKTDNAVETPPIKKSADELVMLTRKLMEVRGILDAADVMKLNMPTIVVIGSQSSGKSSVLESIVGHEFLPKGSNMVTRRPLEMTLVYSPDFTEDVADFPHLGLSNIKDFKRVEEIIRELNESVSKTQHVSDEPIRLRIYSPNVPDLTLIDLPGYIRVSDMSQPMDLKDKITQLCSKYIQEPNIVLAVSAANVDMGNSEALRASREVDGAGTRTLGVLTKMDLIPPEDAITLLTSNRYPLKLGYVGVACPPDHSSKASKPFGFRGGKRKSSDEECEFYFGDHSIFKQSNVSVGINTLKKKLVSVLEQNIAASLSKIAEAIDNELHDTVYKLKVEFGADISEESYVSDLASSLKSNVSELSNSYGKREVRNELRGLLDKQIIQVCENFWIQISDKVKAEKKVTVGDTNEKPALTEAETGKLLRQRATMALIQSGIGRQGVEAVKAHLQKSAEAAANSDLLKYHPNLRRTLLQLAQELVNNRIRETAQQVESNIKPFKYGLDDEISELEWKESFDHTVKILEKEMADCRAKMDSLRREVGRRNLNNAVRQIEDYYLKQAADENAEVPLEVAVPLVHPSVADKAMEAIRLRRRVDLLRERIRKLKRIGPSLEKGIDTCPEVYLGVIASQVSRLASLFIHTEMLLDYYTQFPHLLDKHLFYGLSRKDMISLAHSNPSVKKQLDLQRRRDRLQLASSRVNDLLREQKHREQQPKPTA